MKIRIRIHGFLIFVSVIGSIFLSRFFFPHWEGEVWDEILDALGIGIILFGFLVRIAGRGHKAKGSQEGKALMKDGLYGLMRHPMYFGTLLIGLGIVLTLFVWWLFFVFLVIFLAIYIPQVYKEEENLSGRFGEEYKDYCKRTPKYSPNIFKLFKMRQYLFFNWSGVRRELPSLITAMVLTVAIETWRDVRLFGYAELRKEVLELSLIISLFIIIFTLLFYERKH